MLAVSHKKLLCLVVLIPILVSMTILGMRLPTLAGLTSGKPKPRPRAIIQTQINKIKDSFQQQIQHDFSLSPSVFVIPAIDKSPFFPACTMEATSTKRTTLPARSPPTATAAIAQSS